MKTHTELLTDLIAALYAAPITVETHPLKMLAAEIRGQMQANLPDAGELVKKLIYGDIEAASLEILGGNCPAHEAFQKLDDEQKTRLAAAATVKDFLTNPNATTTQPDADGWIENNGNVPDCDISAIRWYCGEVINVANDKHWAWGMKLPEHWAWGMKLPGPEKFHITHYKPA
jgi:hypothetical protein